MPDQPLKLEGTELARVRGIIAWVNAAFAVMAEPGMMAGAPQATIRRCTKGHSWAVPWGPDINSIGFADLNAGEEVCSRCLVLKAVELGCGIVVK